MNEKWKRRMKYWLAYLLVGCGAVAIIDITIYIVKRNVVEPLSADHNRMLLFVLVLVLFTAYSEWVKLYEKAGERWGGNG